MTDDELRAFATRFFDAVQAGDIDTVYASYAPGAEIWHNTDGVVQTREDNADTLRGFVQRIPQRSYDERRLHVFDGGFVHQHTLRGVRRDGVSVELPAVIVCRVDGGLITRLDEYFDSAHVAAFRAVVAEG